ncbi:hypothetical protein KAU33_09330 [Candidatus Dependentiae bacterium]|nr:hypothetical protein [Candidatus Dependentiae bacterium]
MMNNKLSTTLKTHEKLYYNALFNYCRDYFNISDDVMMQLQVRKVKNRTITQFGSINLSNDKNIIKIIDFKDFDINGANIIHEFTHIKQKLNHEIYMEKVNKRYIIFWHGEAYISHSKYMKAKKDEYYDFPWEVEAYENMELLSDFHRSPYLNDLIGQNKTLDFLFENNVFQ